MSFGFSIGDFVAIGALIVKIISTLQDTPSEYQELIRELDRCAPSLSCAARFIHISLASLAAQTSS